jgi:DNA polymerase I-like protein with 3'-5' exonuclease and polymerase domains
LFDKKANDWKVTNLGETKGRILQADYSQLELRVFAVDAKISWMVGRYLEDADLHAELACELFNKSMDEVFAEGGYWRACAKEFWFGPIYGEGAQGIVDQLKKRHKLVWTKQQGQETLDRLYARMPEFDDYKAQVIADLRSTASVRTVFGRRRYLPTFFSVETWMRARAERQAVNFKIQSAGSDMTTYSWILLNWWARLVGLKSRVVISVHDSLVWDVWPGEEYLICAATKMAMENLPFSWVKNSPIVFKTEMEIGPSWGEIKGIDKAEEFKGVDLDHFIDSRLDPLRERCSTILF